MTSWKDAARRALVSGAAASIASTLVLAALGRRELGRGATPLNGPSQWVWGRHAPHADGFSSRHTVVGYAVHHFAATFWAVLFEKLRPARAPLAAAIATAAVAHVVDFRVVPERLSPGFQKRLSRNAVAWSYVAFAIGLAAAAWALPSPRPSPKGEGDLVPPPLGEGEASPPRGAGHNLSVSSGTTWNKSPTRP